MFYVLSFIVVVIGV